MREWDRWRCLREGGKTRRKAEDSISQSSLSPRCEEDSRSSKLFSIPRKDPEISALEVVARISFAVQEPRMASVKKNITKRRSAKIKEGKCMYLLTIRRLDHDQISLYSRNPIDRLPGSNKPVRGMQVDRTSLDRRSLQIDRSVA